MVQGMETGAGLRRVGLTVRPESRFDVPVSDGYSVYGALLSALESADETVSAQVHDSPLGSLHNGGLDGVFADSDRRHHKTLLPDREYELSLGVVDPADEEIFQALVRALVIDGESIELSHGELRVERFESENSTHEEVLEEAAGCDVPSVTMEFRSCTCIEEAEDVTTMFPHRVPVFRSLLGKWNRTAPADLELDLDRETLLSDVIEKPDARSYGTHSVLVHRAENDAGETRNHFAQGFTGECTYAFKGASESVENAVVALALFGEYSGVGNAVARGCGCVEVTLCG